MVPGRGPQAGCKGVVWWCCKAQAARWINGTGHGSLPSSLCLDVCRCHTLTLLNTKP